jgi:putative sigma-54 modulation protein
LEEPQTREVTMRITVRTHDLDWNEKLQKKVERSIEFAVDRHRDRIDRIAVCLADLNGPRGGVDKLCQMTAEVRGIGTLHISENGSDVTAVAGRAARRLGFRIRRSIERRRGRGAADRRATIRAAR